VAQKKTATSLNRVWVTPPDPARDLVEWGLGQTPPGDLRILHLGALMATHPFFGDICAAVGRAAQSGDVVYTPEIRTRMKALWGDRRTVSNAVQFGIRTLRALGVIAGDRSSSENRVGEALDLPSEWVPWVVHALLVARGMSETDEREIPAAPELFMISLPRVNWAASKYPYLERHTEGGGRAVLVERLRRPQSSEGALPF
jgi:hypothetical protein